MNIKVLVADSNTELCKRLSYKLHNEEHLSVVGTANDGHEAIDLINRFTPDIVLLDIVLPILDGFGVLEYFKPIDSFAKPNFIIITSLGSDEIIKKSINLGASYYIMKPFDIKVLTRRIREVYNDRLDFFRESINITLDRTIENQKSLEQALGYILHHLGIPSRLNGYVYICDSIRCATKDNSLMDSITKHLYPAIAKIHNTKPSSVERAIRHALDFAWSHGYNQNFSNIFPQKNKRPTNRQFICTVMKHLQN